MEKALGLVELGALTEHTEGSKILAIDPPFGNMKRIWAA